jgi:hypothetical protein
MAIIDQFHFHPPARNRQIPLTPSRDLLRSTVVPTQLSIALKQHTRHFRRNPSTNISCEIGEGYQSSQIFVEATPLLRPTLARKRRQDHVCEPRWRWSCQKRIKNLHASPKAKFGRHANSPQSYENCFPDVCAAKLWKCQKLYTVARQHARGASPILANSPLSPAPAPYDLGSPA